VVAPINSILARTSCAALAVESVLGDSTVTSAYAASPLKLLTPRSRGTSVWSYLSSYGGGFVSGDQTRLEVSLGPNTRCFFGTQASTKIYRNAGRRSCGHETRAALAEDAVLVFAPDPVSAYAGSTYTQRQEFRLAKGAGLALVDWLTSGRSARGERWAFSRFASRNEVFVKGERVFLDSLSLNAANDPAGSPHLLGRFNCLGLLVLVGEPMRAAATALLAEVATRAVDRRSPLISSASPVRDGVIFRVAGRHVEEVGRELHRHLDFASALLGDDPWARKW
jgi:urease accessory protein